MPELKQRIGNEIKSTTLFNVFSNVIKWMITIEDTYCKLVDMKYNFDEFSNILQKKKYSRLRFKQDIHIDISA